MWFPLRLASLPVRCRMMAGSLPHSESIPEIAQENDGHREFASPGTAQIRTSIKVMPLGKLGQPRTGLEQTASNDGWRAAYNFATFVR